MKKSSRFSGVCCALALLLALPCSARAAETARAGFSDVSPGDWFAPYVDACAQAGLVNGAGDGRFLPEGAVNNDEALVMAARALWRAEGGEGPLPQGLAPEELVALLGEGQRQLADPALEDARRLSELWPWDGFCYLVRRCSELGVSLPDYCFNTYPATRQDFFRLLALAGRGLPDLNDVAAVPGCRDEEILHLYRAGVLSGTDGYGSFLGQRHLTRAEAAAALARLADPALRLEYKLAPSPWTGYTLTPLGTDTGRLGVDYPVLLLEGKLLTLEGKAVDYPPGRLVGGASFERRGDYCFFQPSAEDFDDEGRHLWRSYAALMDAEGRLPLPAWAYDDLRPLSGGGFLAMKRAEGGACRWYILDAQGGAEKELPGTSGASGNDWHGYNEGLCPWLDGESGLWGYVDADGQWAIPPRWDRADPFHCGQAVVARDGLSGVIDAAGAPVIPLAARTLCAGWVSPGSGAPARYRWEDGTGRNGWLDAEGQSVPGPGADPERGVRPSYQNGYFSDGQTYYDLSGRQCSETFDWCGGLTADGQGFAGLNGQVYRVQFPPRAQTR